MLRGDQELNEARHRFNEQGYLVVQPDSTMDLTSLREQCEVLHAERRSLRFADRDKGEVGLTFVTDVVDSVPQSPLGRTVAAGDATAVAAALLGESVELLYLTLSFKGRGAGDWDWHQDYRYWYEIGCLYPRLITAFIALDEMSARNGCLRVLEGSHAAGRLDHVDHGGQFAADDRMVDLLATECPERELGCDAGAVIFMHCNLLHASGGNDTDDPRRALILNLNGVSARPRLDTRFVPIALPAGRLPKTGYSRRT